MRPASLERWAPLVERALEEVLPPADREPALLHKAIRYSVLAGGKRLRPVLALCAYAACGGEEPEAVVRAAAALELFHTYSLIHDDLPCMDDDDLRRGKPTNHVVFGEALAILAGDALQTLGARLLATEPHGTKWTARRNRVCRDVFAALGPSGMVGGQALDLALTGTGGSADEAALLTIHNLKTGCFLEASLMSGATWAGAGARERRALTEYGKALGLAFQIVDDILDVTSTPDVLGKTPGKDTAQGKATFPALWGLDASRREAQRLLSDSLRALSVFGPRSQELRELAHYVVNRGQ